MSDNITLIQYDLETTGTDPTKARPVQIGARMEIYDDWQRRSEGTILSTLVNPEEPIPEGASNVHGITDEAVAHAPAISWAFWPLTLMLEQLRTNYPKTLLIAGYNVEAYDNVVVEYCCKGLNFNRDYQTLDVLNLLMRYRPGLESHKLGEAHLALTGEELIGAHGALQDCIGTGKILETLCQEEKKSPLTFAKELKTPQVYTKMPIGKHKGQEPKSIPRGWAQWMRNHAGGMRPDLKRTVDWILDER